MRLSQIIKPASAQEQIAEKCILILGSARSGTTWLAEFMNYKRDFRILFEPYWAQELEEWLPRPKGKGMNRPYVRPDEDFALAKLFDRIMLGKYTNDWINLIQEPKNNKKAKKFIVKDIRLHLMAGWIANRHPNMPFIFLVRHPFATAASCVRLGWKGQAKQLFLTQENLVEDHLDEERVKLIKAADTPFEQFIAVWCVDNYVAIKQLKDKPNVYPVFYELLRDKPNKLIPPLLEHAHIESTQEVVEASTQRSSTDNKKLGKQPKKQNWSEKFSKKEIEYARKCLKAFELDGMYEENGGPRLDNPFQVW